MACLDSGSNIYHIWVCYSNSQPDGMRILSRAQNKKGLKQVQGLCTLLSIKPCDPADPRMLEVAVENKNTV